MRNYDVVVIGSGPGGQKAAVQAAKSGKRVALIEREREIGGACVYKGTIPSKTLREAALALDRMKRNASAFNFSLRDGIEVAALMERLDQVLIAHDRFIGDQMRRNAIDVIHGRAKLVGPREVEVLAINGDKTRYGAETIVIATGSRPRMPDDMDVDHENILDSDSILSMIYLPRSITVLGGGVIACEYASIFAVLGVEVTIVDRAPRPLMFMDPELTGLFVQRFENSGGRYLGSQDIRSVQWDGATKVHTSLASGEVIASDKVLVALGRSANVEGLGLDTVGVEQSARGHVAVDEHYQTNIPGIYAVGDVIGPPSLASCSMEQGRRAMCHALSIDPGAAFELVPIGIYAVPEIASVGLTEVQAHEKYKQVVVGRARFEEIARGQIAGIENGMLKLIVDGQTLNILGVQIIGDGSTDLVHVGEYAMLNENDYTVFLENIFNFPTLGEAYRVAALDVFNQLRMK